MVISETLILKNKSTFHFYQPRSATMLDILVESKQTFIDSLRFI